MQRLLLPALALLAAGGAIRLTGTAVTF